MMMMMITSDIP